VELLTAISFCCCWIAFGHQSAWLALTYCLFLAGLIVATFIDFEHFIIPDEITFGGIVVGFLISFAIPLLHGERSLVGGMKQSAYGIAVGAGLIYFILRLGKLLFGRLKVELPDGARVVFTETALHLPGEELLYEELFYRPSDAIRLRAHTVELVDRCYKNVLVRLSPSKLQIGDETLNPETVPHLEAVCGEVILPREAMGLGDVKFMAAIGAFLGWQAVIFSLMVSSLIGSFVGVTAILLRKQEWSSKIPYGPYIALASAIWIFWGNSFVQWWFSGLR
jgi:leader peptidase (prepilin peptidase)/N-methyltransferase